MRERETRNLTPFIKEMLVLARASLVVETSDRMYALSSFSFVNQFSIHYCINMPIQLIKDCLRGRNSSSNNNNNNNHNVDRLDRHFTRTLLHHHHHHHKVQHHAHVSGQSSVWSRIMSHLRAAHHQPAEDGQIKEDDEARQQVRVTDADGDSNTTTAGRAQQQSPDDNAIDPATGLSKRQKDYVQQSWQLVRQDLRAAGLGFFSAFFKAHPEYQRMFKSFTDVPVDQLSESASFRAHAMNVMNAVSLVVDSLDNPGRLVNELKRLGQSHGRHNIEQVHFRNLTVVLVAFLGEALGDEVFTEDVKQSWIKALDVVVGVVATGLDGQK